MIGKFLGGFFGYWVAGLFGALIGIGLGHRFDKGLTGIAFQHAGASRPEDTQRLFFTTIFSVMGSLAKSDGKVTQDEINFARNVMGQMQLDDAMRREAIELFNRGKQIDFPLEQTLLTFRQECGNYRDLLRMFIEILMHVAYADGVLETSERQFLENVREILGFSVFEFRQIEALVKHARDFSGNAGSQYQRTSAPAAGQVLAEAYEIMGMTPQSTDRKSRRPTAA